jgi:hypothetical protein
VSTQVSVDKTLRRCSDAAVMFYLMMIPAVEEDATITADLDELAATVVPNRPGWTVSKVGRVISELEDADLFVSHEGRLYLPPENFYRYQSNIGAEKRRTWHPMKTPCTEPVQKKFPETARNSTSSSPSPSLSPSPSPSTRAREIDSELVDELLSTAATIRSKRATWKPSQADRVTIAALCEQFPPEQMRRELLKLKAYAAQRDYQEFGRTFASWMGRVVPDPMTVPRVDARKVRMERARAELEAGDPDGQAKAFCHPDEWAEITGAVNG